MSDQPPGEPGPERPPGRPRGRQTVGDMVRSLAVVMVFVGILVVFNVARQPDPVLRAVDYPAALDGAQPQVDYPLAGPDPLPPGWRVTSARTGTDRAAVTWHLGIVTADDRYVAVEQTDGPRADLVARIAAGARAGRDVLVAGETWQRLAGGDPEPRALVRAADGVTTMVAGSGSWAELRTLAASLG